MSQETMDRLLKSVLTTKRQATEEAQIRARDKGLIPPPDPWLAQFSAALSAHVFDETLAYIAKKGCENCAGDAVIRRSKLHKRGVIR